MSRAKIRRDVLCGKVLQIDMGYPFPGFSYVRVRKGEWVDVLGGLFSHPLEIQEIHKLKTIGVLSVPQKGKERYDKYHQIIGDMFYESEAEAEAPIAPLMYSGKSITEASKVTVWDPVTKKSRDATDEEKRTQPRLTVCSPAGLAHAVALENKVIPPDWLAKYGPDYVIEGYRNLYRDPL